MKQEINFKNLFFIPLLAIVTTFIGCNDNSDLGMELLPSTDLIEVKNLVEKNKFSAFTYTDGPIRTDEATRSLLGSFYDPVFGITTINLATQFRILFTPKFGENPLADSVILYLNYRFVYGDTVTPQHFKVYELINPIFADSTNSSGGSFDYPYYQNEDLKSLASETMLGERFYTPRIRLNPTTKDTLDQIISIPLDVSLGNKLLNATESQMANNENFLEFFNGLLIESGSQVSPGGSILTMDIVYGDSTALVVYYKNDQTRPSDSTLYNPYFISPFSARVNSIVHDYTPTAFGANLNADAVEDSLIYVQATGGLKSKILIEELSSWRDSSNIAINKAELVFQVDTIASEFRKYPPPSQLLFTFVNESGQEDLPADYWFSPTFYGGFLRPADYTYRFNITQHLQRILEGEVQNNGFFLTTARKNSEANRVVLKGSTSQTGIRLIITYSKFAK